MLALAFACLGMDLTPESYLQMLHDDLSLEHHAVPRGVGDANWAKKPRIGYGNRLPEGWNAFVPWGQVYVPESGSPSTNTRVQISDLQSTLLLKKTNRWIPLLSSKKVEGAAYVESFANDVNRPANVREEADGSISIKLTSGYNYHFWTPGDRKTLERDDIAGIVTLVRARLVVDDPKQPDDRAQARFLMSMGADYWQKPDSQWDQWKTNGDVAIGRFRWITQDWQWYSMSTLPLADLKRNPPPMPRLL